jgi:hypothetical protein
MSYYLYKVYYVIYIYLVIYLVIYLFSKVVFLNFNESDFLLFLNGVGGKGRSRII